MDFYRVDFSMKFMGEVKTVFPHKTFWGLTQDVDSYSFTTSVFHQKQLQLTSLSQIKLLARVFSRQEAIRGLRVPVYSH